MPYDQLAAELGFDHETNRFYDIDELPEGLESTSDLALDTLDDFGDFDDLD